MSIVEWPLQEVNITESVCKSCAICCEIEQYNKVIKKLGML